MKRFSLSLSLILIPMLLALLFLVQCDCDEEEDVTPYIQPEPQPLIFGGFVRDAETQQPIQGVTLTIKNMDGIVITFDEPIVTAANGSYNIEAADITEKALKITATKLGYLPGKTIATLNEDKTSASVGAILLTELAATDNYIEKNVESNEGDVLLAFAPNELPAGSEFRSVIPANALNTDTKISMAPLSVAQVAPPNDPDAPILSVVDFGPNGTVFATPIEVYFPLPTPMEVGTLLDLAYYDEEQGRWIDDGLVEVVADGNSRDLSQKARGVVSHFTQWSAYDRRSGITYTLESNRHTEWAEPNDAEHGSNKVATEGYTILPYPPGGESDTKSVDKTWNWAATLDIDTGDFEAAQPNGFGTSGAWIRSQIWIKEEYAPAATPYDNNTKVDRSQTVSYSRGRAPSETPPSGYRWYWVPKAKRYTANINGTWRQEKSGITISPHTENYEVQSYWYEVPANTAKDPALVDPVSNPQGYIHWRYQHIQGGGK